MRAEEIEVGGVYESAKGWTRIVSARSRDDVFWRHWNRNGNPNGFGNVHKCKTRSFAHWAVRRVESAPATQRGEQSNDTNAARRDAGEGEE